MPTQSDITVLEPATYTPPGGGPPSRWSSATGLRLPSVDALRGLVMIIMAVTLNGESRAYPIREMGYHHIVNDRLNGLPMVVTY